MTARALRAGVLDHRARDRAARASEGRHFTGVMNSGFFATADGVQVIEFNARFGDPECMNIMSLFDGDWPRVMERICAGELTRADVPLREEASLVLYLVSPDYALPRGGAAPTAYEFELDVDGDRARRLPACSSPRPCTSPATPTAPSAPRARSRSPRPRRRCARRTSGSSQLRRLGRRAGVAPRRRRRALPAGPERPRSPGLTAIVQGWPQ